MLVKVASSAIRLDNPAESRWRVESEGARLLGVIDEVKSAVVQLSMRAC